MTFPPLSTTHCAICGYDRAAIPESPRCPECGFPFHEPLRVVRTRPFPIWIALACGLVATGLMDSVLAPSIRRMRTLSPRDTRMVIGLVTMGLPTLVALCPFGVVGIGCTGIAVASLGRRRWIRYCECEVFRRAHGVFAFRDSSGGPLWLPIAGMRWRKRLLLEAEIAAAWARSRGFDGRADALP